ncbi:protein serine/threonine phosphatase [Halothece sp. PCC 7418]|uniref:PP2C family protein-serine/threonine phosphatase n=1 Tax=Halothece sp. (strain PCC 7418) TaxID=65093 RepID=UPI0002A085AF|nr:protein phosphatase 2C domain-containing protein [Halothece sp. PCC 7418]AFZ44365.1 protein serine/threonine phosphatase [Halothece sp. PCC 7418]
MDEAQKILRCSLKYCQTPNSLSSQFCSRCESPLIQRYLWVVGTRLAPAQIQQLIGQRYLVISEKLVLDTQPGIPPYFPERIPPWLKPYLRLSPYRLHIPKLYGQIPREDPTPDHDTKPEQGSESEVWLLEYENFSSSVQEKFAKGEFLPTLEIAWSSASGIRQLNWLLQISQLWQPMAAQGVVKTLLSPELLRVNGSVVQLQELEADRATVTLKDLGKMWSNWIADADQTIESFLQDTCHRLQKGELDNSETLTDLLEEGLRETARSQPIHYQIATTTDSGPSRSHNEDAYYQKEETCEFPPTQKALAIVCDGVGGHQGGEVASQLAIEHLRQEFQNLPELSPKREVVTEQIEKAISKVNDIICDQNDVENRKAQERMGTTLVMALGHNHEMYVTHVGDSRVYWITTSGCYQLTLDDDLASRQTRLGHLLYREALQQPAAGSLIQALGMSSSKLLHPTTQRLVLDEDCVFLLCSDGLSDNGLVEQYWEVEILPVLEADKDLDTVAQRLVALANNLNGHDNVTVSLLQCSLSELQDHGALTLNLAEVTQIQTSKEKGSTLASPTNKRQQGVMLLLLILALVMGGMGMAYWLFPEVRQSLDQFQEQLRSKPMRDPSDLPSPD